MVVEPLADPADISQDVLTAVRSVLGASSALIPLHEPEFGGNEWAYVKDCIDTGWVSSVGSYVNRIEADLAAYTGVAHAIATVNGTAALHICAILAGVEPGDEVLMPALTFIATANAATYSGAVPHFVDSEEQTLGVDADRLEKHLNDVAEIVDGRCINHRTGAVIRALMVMHVFGHPADLDALASLCERWRLVLIEDAAESLGSYYHGRHTGNVGRIAALSFNGNKVMTTGGGGAILTNDPDLARHAKHLTTTARVAHRWNFVHDEIGYNYRLPNINAALGCAQLEQVPDMLVRKRRLAERYAAAFAAVPGVRFMTEPEGSHSNYWLDTIVLDPAHTGEHEAVLKALNDANYMSRPLWTLMHQLPMYASCPRADLSVAEGLAGRVINLPSSPKLADGV
jgi:perosamine synthetase